MKITLRGAALSFVLIVTAMLPAAASAGVDEPALVVSIAQAQIGKPFRLGTQGPTRFDCSGLVYFVFSQANLIDRIGGRRMLATEYYRWGRERGLLSRTNPRVGDLAMWAYSGSSRIKHIGIYVGNNARGKPLAISALTVGVMRHRVEGISVPFFTYMHVNLGIVPDPTPPPTPSPSPSPSPSPIPSGAPTPLPTEGPTPIPT